MRHRKKTFKINRTSSHRRCLVANLLKNLILNGRLETTLVKAKELKRHADKLITLAKKDTLSTKRSAIAKLMIRYNKLNSKESRQAKGGDLSVYNSDRKIIGKLFNELGPRFTSRPGGYTRIIRHRARVGDNASMCIIEYLPE